MTLSLCRQLWLRFVFVMSLLFASVVALPAFAAEITSCGTASSYNLPTTSPVPACDIYTRQLQYRDEAIKLRQQIQARAVEYSRPSAILHKQYKANLQALHDTITEENIPSFFATWDDAYGE